MSLKSLHMAFISICTVLSAFLVLWGVQTYRSEGSALSLEIIIAGALGLMALVPYFFWVRKKFKTIQSALFAFLALLPSWTADACSVCFGDPNSGMSKGIKAGVILLVLVVTAVLGGIASVAISWSRRAKTLTHHLNP